MRPVPRKPNSPIVDSMPRLHRSKTRPAYKDHLPYRHKGRQTKVLSWLVFSPSAARTLSPKQSNTAALAWRSDARGASHHHQLDFDSVEHRKLSDGIVADGLKGETTYTG